MKILVSLRRIGATVLVGVALLAGFAFFSQPTAAVSTSRIDPLLPALLRAQARSAALINSYEYTVDWQRGQNGFLGKMTVLERGDAEVVCKQDRMKMRATTERVNHAVPGPTAVERVIFFEPDRTLCIRVGEPGEILQITCDERDPAGPPVLRALATPDLTGFARGGYGLTLEERVREFPDSTWTVEIANGSCGAYRVTQLGADGRIMAQFVLDGQKGFLVTEAHFFDGGGAVTTHTRLVAERHGVGWFPTAVRIDSGEWTSKYELANLRVNHDVPEGQFELGNLGIDLTGYEVRRLTFDKGAMGWKTDLEARGADGPFES